MRKQLIWRRERAGREMKRKKKSFIECHWLSSRYHLRLTDVYSVLAGTCIACERQKPVRRQSSGSRATAQSNHEDTRKKCIFVFLGNLRRQRQRQLIEQVSRSSLDEHLGGGAWCKRGIFSLQQLAVKLVCVFSKRKREHDYARLVCRLWKSEIQGRANNVQCAFSKVVSILKRSTDC